MTVKPMPPTEPPGAPGHNLFRYSLAFGGPISEKMPGAKFARTCTFAASALGAAILTAGASNAAVYNLRYEFEAVVEKAYLEGVVSPVRIPHPGLDVGETAVGTIDLSLDLSKAHQTILFVSCQWSAATECLFDEPFICDTSTTRLTSIPGPGQCGCGGASCMEVQS